MSSNTTTSWPSATRRRVSADPMKPAPPVIRYLISPQGPWLSQHVWTVACPLHYHSGAQCANLADIGISLIVQPFPIGLVVGVLGGEATGLGVCGIEQGPAGRIVQVFDDDFRAVGKTTGTPPQVSPHIVTAIMSELRVCDQAQG